MFMQAGFLLLEVGFSRMKNVGAGVAKIVSTLASPRSPSGRSVGLAFAAATGSPVTTGSSRHRPGPARRRGRAGRCVRRRSCSSGSLLRGLAGDRLGHDARADQVRRLPDLRSGVRRRASTRSSATGSSVAVGCRSRCGMQDFAGSTVVHLMGATGALAALLLLGPRRGKYGTDGKPRAIPGHSMPLVGLGVLILWLGWFGFNPGSTLVFGDALGIGLRSPRSRSSRTSRPRPASSARSASCTGAARRSTSAWPATARSPVSSRSRRRPATSSTGRRRSSAPSAASSSSSACWRSRRSSTTRSARSRRTAWPVSGARSRAVCSPPALSREFNAVGDPDGRPLVLGLARPARRTRRSASRRRSRSCS